MASIARPPIRPGTIGFAQIGGLVGALIRLGQLLIGDGSRWTHVFIVLDDDTVLEAMPSGARIAPLSQFDGCHVGYLYPLALDDDEQARVVAAARSMVGTRYGFSAYAYLALVFLGVESRRLSGYLERNGRMICSQTADMAYNRAGIELFADGRPPFSVTPGDLANLPVERDLSIRST